jgi:hypothetical protein
MSEAARDHALTNARSADDGQTSVDDVVVNEAFRFVHGLLVGLAISASLWGMLAALGYAAYLLVTTV